MSFIYYLTCPTRTQRVDEQLYYFAVNPVSVRCRE